MNIGTKQWYSECCGADFCNKLDLSEPSTIIPNGNKCYSCKGQSCTNTVFCSGSEDRCITATGISDVFKGCISKSLCDGTTPIPNIVDFSCCEGNLCNGAQTTTPITTPSTTMSSTTSTTPSTTMSSTLSTTMSTTMSSTPNTTMSSTTKVTTSVAQNSTFNSAKSVSQSFLFLCCSLLSFFLLH
ncbi:cell wall protein DAN4-like [Megalobrama amblycephala]|uniref:cell wall protein DAN4-like n=1 Tax=Megalobrama amblycephala TaxID=75352 RepID=UPI002014529F|nr:cell wall protein DAN4-like [Megalobrama amblycephala]